jgi:hypothetical protein
MDVLSGDDSQAAKNIGLVVSSTFFAQALMFAYK